MGVYKKQPKKISRLIISDIEKLMFYYRQKYITVFYGFIRCNKVITNYESFLFVIPNAVRNLVRKRKKIHRLRSE